VRQKPDAVEMSKAEGWYRKPITFVVSTQATQQGDRRSVRFTLGPAAPGVRCVPREVDFVFPAPTALIS